MQIEIRPAQPADVDWILPELKAFSQFYNTKRELYPTEEHAIVVVKQLIAHHCFLIAERDGVRVGFIAGLLSPHFFNPTILTLAELFWWVQPEHRYSRAGSLLIDAFINWGQMRHVDWITQGLEAKSPVNDKTLTNRGFKLHERSFLMEVS